MDPEHGDVRVYSQLGHIVATFAAETMSALEGLEDAIAIRAYYQAAILGEVTEVGPIISITDCRSVYDSVHRAEGPRAPSEKRLIIDLAALKQLVIGQQDPWGQGDALGAD